MEVYGEKPKKFTAKWWEYIWEYYKWHIISVIFVVFIVVTTLRQCTTRPSYDLQITMATEQEIVLSQQEALRQYAEGVISDATENGELQAYIVPIAINDQSDSQTLQVQYARFTVELTVPESYVFIVSKQYVDAVKESELLESTSVWADGSEDEYLISLKGNEKLTALGIDTEELYLGVVKLIDKKKDDNVERVRYENGVRFSRYLIGLE